MISFDNTEIAFRYKTDTGMRRAYWLFIMISFRFLVRISKRLVYLALKLKIPMDWAIKPTLYQHFVGGESIRKCEPTVKLLADHKVRSILDYSVEGGKDSATMERTLNETLRTIENAASNPDIPFAVFKPTAFATIRVLTLAAKNDLFEYSTQDGVSRFGYRVTTLCYKAWELGIPIMIDAEDSWYQNYIDDFVTHMMTRFNTEKAIVYNTLQMYRTDRIEYLKKSIEQAREGKYFLGIKFVRGAYMEKERKRAKKYGYPSPIHPDKASTDAAYDEALTIAMQNLDVVSIFNGTHNEASNLHLIRLMEEHGIEKNDPRIWFSQLYGMSDHISFNLAHEGYNVAKYIPYGPVSHILPYLFRRAEENTSISGQTSRELSLIRKEMKRRSKAGRQ